MAVRTARRDVVTLACAIVLLAGCTSTGHREAEPVASVRPPTSTQAERKAEDVARRVETKAARSEKAEGKQDLVEDDVRVKSGSDGQPVVEQKGEASFYGKGFHGKKTAAGDRFDQREMTAAHPALPLGTKAKVTNLDTGKSADVTINDRGPYAKGRDIDVSKAVAEKIGIGKEGAAPVKIEAEVTPAPTQ